MMTRLRITQGFNLLALLAITATGVMTTGAQTVEQPDLSKQPTLYAVGYAHLDTEWRWEYPQVIDEYLKKTMTANFSLIDKYPHYIFNFSGANRYRLMKEYYPADFKRLQQYVAAGRWFPAGSSMEEGDVNAPSAEAIIRQILYGNIWFQDELGKSSAEYMLPDCFGFPSSLPSILAHTGVKGFSTQKLSWGSSANVGGPESIENTPEGTPFNVGVWVGPDGSSVLAAVNPGSYNGRISSDLSTPLPPDRPNPALAEVQAKLGKLTESAEKLHASGKPIDQQTIDDYLSLSAEQSALMHAQREHAQQRYQHDWAARVQGNGKATGVFTDYHYYGTGDIGGSPDEESVKRLEAIVTKGQVDMPPANAVFFSMDDHPAYPEVKVGEGPVHVISATADQMFRDITPAETAALPRYTGELELTNHSAGSLTSQAYQKRWIRKEELLADAAEKSAVAATWLGARPYPQQRLNDAWTLAMAAHFHDLAAGTATPKSYEFAWNDDVIALNQFADVLQDSAEGISSALDTQVKGTPIVVFNPLNIEREDLVEAHIDFPGSTPKEAHVVTPDGKEIPAQITNGKVVFLAHLPSVAYAVYDIVPGAATSSDTSLRVTQNELENDYYHVKLNTDGDVASIFDKTTKRELLAAPARLALSYDNPEQWPAWNMDWSQEQAAPKAYVSGPAKIRVVENGPARVAIEVTRETAGSRFTQTVSLAAGDAGKRVEFGNVIDWNTKETNLKATFPLTASNEMATYNWDIGTIQRPTAQPKKFEVPSHQWIDLTDMSDRFGATILTDCKNGSDKPNDHTIRLTLIRTPGTAGGYADQGTQDIGHHEFVYGIAGHADGWRASQTDWQAQRLNAPLIGFVTEKHAGTLGKSFSLLKVSNPRIRVMAVKKAERSDEVIVRLVELDGKPQDNVRVSFAAPIASAREVNGQEQPLGAATVDDGALVASFGAYQPRAFALKLTPPSAKAAGIQSQPVTLKYDIATATDDGDHASAGFDGKGNSLPAEMLPAQIKFNDVTFQLAPSKTGTPDAISARGQTIALPAGDFNRVYLLAASADGDQKATFKAGSNKAELNIENWGGYVGQWDNRSWSSAVAGRDSYGEMTGLTPGYIKRADLAWYSSHHHDATGKNVAYSYSYLFSYAIDLPVGVKTLKLPKNDRIRILAISVAEENPELSQAQPLYDVLPSPNAGEPDFTLSAAPTLSVSQGRSIESRLTIMPRGKFSGDIHLSASGLPAGVKASFSPAVTSGSSVLTLVASPSASKQSAVLTINAEAGNISHSANVNVMVSPILSGTTPVNLSSAFNVTGIYKDGEKFDEGKSLDGGGYALSEKLLGSEQVGAEVVFKLGAAGVPDAVSGKTVDLPAGKFSSLRVLGVGVEGKQEDQPFTVHYADGTSSVVTQSLSDWSSSSVVSGETVALEMPYRLSGDGDTDTNSFKLGAYSISLDKNKEVRSVSLPQNRNVVVFAMTLVPAVE
jgi:alpha-mannosidase